MDSGIYFKGHAGMESHELVWLTAWNACELHRLRFGPDGWREYLDYERTVRALSNFRLAVLDDGYESFGDAIDGFDWVTLEPFNRSAGND